MTYCTDRYGKAKATYLTRKAAKQAARRWNPAALMFGERLRKYHCPDCGLYHIAHVGGAA